MRTVFSLLLSLFCLFFLSVPSVLAASTTMSVSPQSGSYGSPFTVSLVIDGHGDKFNAAQATVTLSPALATKDLTLGDCNFSFLKTPSIQNPSFAGVILSAYATKCTVYTVTLVPTAKGQGAITLSKTSVRRYGDAANVLSATTNGSYTLTAALKAPAVLGTQSVNGSQNGLYTVILKIQSSQDAPVSDATVLLNPVAGKSKQQGTTDATGTVRFSNLQAGIYDATVEENKTKVGENIINVSGQSNVLTLGINLKGEQQNPLLKTTNPFFKTLSTSPLLIAGIVLVGVIAGTVLTIVLTRLKGSRKIPT